MSWSIMITVVSRGIDANMTSRSIARCRKARQRWHATARAAFAQAPWQAQPDAFRIGNIGHRMCLPNAKVRPYRGHGGPRLRDRRKTTKAATSASAERQQAEQAERDVVFRSVSPVNRSNDLVGSRQSKKCARLLSARNT